ncbi:hypothetical protein E2C01_068150 [Portunus trituberculatus]|uniref:Uncharacterized protein n=1 Tax=Portunus trituberculatus TaxID=210409 RepID=A0A5B7HR69_PORTR|nr:hypothetical protein [Portunus trituberculatus]
MLHLTCAIFDRSRKPTGRQRQKTGELLHGRASPLPILPHSRLKVRTGKGNHLATAKSPSSQHTTPPLPFISHDNTKAISLLPRNLVPPPPPPRPRPCSCRTHNKHPHAPHTPQHLHASSAASLALKTSVRSESRYPVAGHTREK